jgi:hypothetical protein
MGTAIRRIIAPTPTQCQAKMESKTRFVKGKDKMARALIGFDLHQITCVDDAALQH